ncbi:MAG: hypothetical protein ACRCWF_15115 [Beijerinckiaceae bacterium]
MAFEYKCVAGPTIVAVKSAKARDQAVKAFEDIMNAEAAHGWEYVGIDEFHVSEPEGWLSRKRVYVPSKILVFRREKEASAVAEALALQKRDLAPEAVSSAPMAAIAAPAASVVEAEVIDITKDATAKGRALAKGR